MFRHFIRSSLRHKTRIPSTLTALGVSASLLYLAAGRSAGLTKVIRCDSGTSLDDDELELESNDSGRFKRPRWKEEDYLSADQILSLGPTWIPSQKCGILRCDALIVNANTESEDSIAVYFPETNEPDDRRTFLALFDGHNGRAMSDFLCDHLLGYVANALSRLPQQYHNDNVMFDSDRQDDDLDSEDIIATTIKECFKDVDDAMLDVADVLASPSKTNAVRTLRHAYSGSCALMSVYDVDTKLLRVALTGDSRAVLGRKIVRSESESQLSSDTTKTYYTVHPLSFDQNAYNPSEVTRLQAEHPGEKVVENERIMGWGISRAFGNGQMKWSLDIQKQLYEKYLGRTVRSYMKTPPYLTAEPEVMTTRIRKGDFLIMASDGLWDCITSEEAVGLVGVWLEHHSDTVYGAKRSQLQPQPQSQHSQSKTKTLALNAVPPTATKITVYEPHELPLESLRLKKLSSGSQSGQREGTTSSDPSERASNYAYWRAEKRFALTTNSNQSNSGRDAGGSVAAHLARNALGGADKDLTEALLSFDTSGGTARRLRDDMAILVVFFD